LHRSYNESNARENASSRIAFSSIVTVCWIDETAEMVDDDRNVLKRIVTGDESWCFMYDPETKRQSATWLSPKEPKA
jgi:hypothetical protein